MWGVVFIIALVIELLTTELVSVWFCGGAVISAVLAAVDLPFWVQLVVWVAVSSVLFVIGRRFLLKKFKLKSVGTNTDALIGQEILITETVDKTTKGAGRFRDVTWTVVSDEKIESGEFAVIKEISGNKLIVEKKK